MPQREDILDIAGRLFWQKGYTGTSMQDISNAIGILKGSLYYYFPSKEHILFEVIMSGLNEILPEAEKIYTIDVGCDEKLSALVQLHIKMLLGKHRKVPMLFLHERENLNNEHRIGYLTLRDKYEAFFRKVIEEGIQNGEFSVNIDKKMVVFAIMGIGNWAPHWYKEDGRWSVQSIAEQISELVLRMVSKPD